MKDKAFALRIAGIPFCFQGTGGDSLLRVFEEKYAHFLLNTIPESSGSLAVYASLVSSSNGNSPDLVVSASENHVFLSRGAMTAELDLTARRASVSLPPNITSVDTFLRVCLTFLLLEKNGFLMHAAGIARNGSGFCFFGPSGAGKTTLSEKFLQSEILSDEICAVTVEDGGVYLHGTPFWGDLARREGAWGQPVKTPLEGFFRIEKGVTFHCEAMKPSEAVKELLQSVVFYIDAKEYAQLLFGLSCRAMERVPVTRLFLTKEENSDRSLKNFLDKKRAADYVPA